MVNSIMENLGAGGAFKEELQISRTHRSATATLRIFTIRDGDFKVSISPSLSLTGYGKTNEEAQQMLKEALDDYFVSLFSLKKSEMEIELARYGWKKTLFNKHFHNQAHIDKNGVLKNLDLPEDTPIEESVIKVA